MHLISAIDNFRPRKGLRAPSAIWFYLLVFSASLGLLYRPQNLAASVPIGIGAASVSMPLAHQSATPVPPKPAPGPALPLDTHDSPWPNNYAFGNCTWYVAHLRPVPPHWGNANNWAYAARAAGWAVSSTPRVGAIAQTSAGWVGHVALVMAVEPTRVLVTEMNHIGFNLTDERWVAPGEFRYIYEN